MKYFYVLIFALFIQHQLQACSAFYAKDKNNIYVGINVDWKVSDSQIHFFPPANNKYGYLNFNIRGYFDNSFGDTGGINDQGLFYEWTDNLYPKDFSFHVPGTVNYNGYIIDLIMTTCTTVEEAENLFKTYNAPYFSYTHLLIGDRSGNSLVIERAENDSLTFIRSGKSYQLVTNFLNSYLDNPKTTDFIACYRYEYIDKMLEDNKDISMDLFRTILDGAANKGQENPTIFSIIYDIKNLVVYTYINQNYEETFKFNLIEELKKGQHSLSLPQLFSGIKGIYPVSDELIKSSSVNLSWVGDVDDYEILLSTNKEFTDPISTKTKNINYETVSLPGLFVLMLFLSSALIRKKKKILIIGIFILFSVGGCEKNNVELPEMFSTIKHSKTINGLLPNNTYYWKIIVSGENGYKTESKVYSFLTSDFNNHKN
jgi:hypothetical protein